MKYIANLIILFSLCFLFSCTTQNKCFRKFPPQLIIKDSISTITDTFLVIRTDTVYWLINADTVYDTRIVYIDRETGLYKADTSILTNDFSISKAWVNRILNHELIQKDSTIVMTFEAYDTMIKTLTARYRTETKIYKEKYIPKFWKYMGYSGMALWFVVIIVLAIRFIPQLKIIRTFLRF